MGDKPGSVGSRAGGCAPRPYAQSSRRGARRWGGKPRWRQLAGRELEAPAALYTRDRTGGGPQGGGEPPGGGPRCAPQKRERKLVTATHRVVRIEAVG